MDIERSNLLAFARLAVRDVIRSSSIKRHLLVDTDLSLSECSTPEVNVQVSCRRLLTILEHCLCHGLRRDVLDVKSLTKFSPESRACDVLRHSASLIWRAKEQILPTTSPAVYSTVHPDPWPVLLFAERCVSESDPASESVRAISEVCTGLGRCRIWMRQALMQKRLGLYIQHLVDRLRGNRDHFYDPHPTTPCSADENDRTVSGDVLKSNSDFYYHPGAMLLNDEGTVLAGLLVGLSSIDFCFILKNNLKDLDTGLQPIPYSVYMPNAFGIIEQVNLHDNAYSDVDICSIVDQKTYLEDTNAKLLKRYEDVQQAYRDQEETARALAAKVNELRLENRGLRIVLSHLKADSQDGFVERHSLASEELSSTTERAHVVPQINGVVKDHSSLPIADGANELQRLQDKTNGQALALQSYREKLSDSESRVVHLERQLSSTRTLLEQKQLLVQQLQSKSQGLTTIMEQMRERLKGLSTEKVSMDRALDQLKLQLSELQSRSSQQDVDLKNQRELISNLESQLSERLTELEQLQPKIAELDTYKQRVQQLEAEVAHWRTLSHEQETSLSEMAAVVSSSKLEADSLRESHTALKDAQWADDSVVSNCLQCNIPFSMSRRRHHCRNCGLIFCHNCSSNAMSLPSSSKPVRVCDKCHALLLLRYAAKP